MGVSVFRVAGRLWVKSILHFRSNNKKQVDAHVQQLSHSSRWHRYQQAVKLKRMFISRVPIEAGRGGSRSCDVGRVSPFGEACSGSGGVDSGYSLVVYGLRVTDIGPLRGPVTGRSVSK